MIHVNYEQGCLTLTMQRPEARNALSREMYGKLAEEINNAEKREDCHAIVLKGAAGHFTAGNDLADFMQVPEGDIPAMDFLRALVNTNVPIVAAVEGYAVGIGVTMLQHCDFVYADPEAIFTMPFVSLGLCPEGGTTLVLESLVGKRRSNEWLLLAKRFGSQEALDAGLISAISPKGEVAAQAAECVQNLAKQPLQALRLSKKMLREPGRAALLAAMDAETALFLERLKSKEAQQAFAQFFNSK